MEKIETKGVPFPTQRDARCLNKKVNLILTKIWQDILNCLPCTCRMSARITFGWSPRRTTGRSTCAAPTPSTPSAEPSKTPRWVRFGSAVEFYERSVRKTPLQWLWELEQKQRYSRNSYLRSLAEIKRKKVPSTSELFLVWAQECNVIFHR